MIRSLLFFPPLLGSSFPIHFQNRHQPFFLISSSPGFNDSWLMLWVRAGPHGCKRHKSFAPFIPQPSLTFSPYIPVARKASDHTPKFVRFSSEPFIHPAAFINQSSYNQSARSPMLPPSSCLFLSRAINQLFMFVAYRLLGEGERPLSTIQPLPSRPHPSQAHHAINGQVGVIHPARRSLILEHYKEIIKKNLFRIRPSQPIYHYSL